MTPYAEGRGRLVTLGPRGVAALGEPGRFVETMDWDEAWAYWELIHGDS